MVAVAAELLDWDLEEAMRGGPAGGKIDRKCRKSNIYNFILQELSLFMFQCETNKKR